MLPIGIERQVCQSPNFKRQDWNFLIDSPSVFFILKDRGKSCILDDFRPVAWIPLQSLVLGISTVARFGILP